MRLLRLASQRYMLPRLRYYLTTAGWWMERKDLIPCWVHHVSNSKGLKTLFFCMLSYWRYATTIEIVKNLLGENVKFQYLCVVQAAAWDVNLSSHRARVSLLTVSWWMILHGTESNGSFPEISIVVTMLYFDVVTVVTLYLYWFWYLNGISMHVRDH